MMGAVVVAMLLLTLGACSSSGGGGSTQTPAQLAARWPADVDALTTSHPDKATLTEIRKDVPGAQTVLIGRLTRTGGALGHAMGISTSILPDVVLVSGATSTSADLRRQVLKAAFTPIGVEAYASKHYDSLLLHTSFDGPGGMSGGYLPTETKLAGFVAPASTAVMFAFTAHGVGVVVLGASITRDQADEVARTLEG